MEDFTTNILMQYFRHTKYSSFQRQLNLYGFRKVARGPDTGAYTHEAFLRDEPDMLEYVRRLPQGLGCNVSLLTPPPTKRTVKGSNNDKDTGGNHKLVLKRSADDQRAFSSVAVSGKHQRNSPWSGSSDDVDGDHKEADGDEEEEEEGEEGDQQAPALSGFRPLPGVPRLSSETLVEVALSNALVGQGEGAPIWQLPSPPPLRPLFRDESSEDSVASEAEAAGTSSATGYWQDDFTSSLFGEEEDGASFGAGQEGVVRHQPLPNELVVPQESMLPLLPAGVLDSSVRSLSESVNKLALDKQQEEQAAEQFKAQMLQVPVAVATPAAVTVEQALVDTAPTAPQQSAAPSSSSSRTWPSVSPSPGTVPPLRVPILGRSSSSVVPQPDPLDVLGTGFSTDSDHLLARTSSLAFDLEPPSPTSPLFPSVLKSQEALISRLTSDDWQVSSLSAVVGAPSFDPAALDTIFVPKPSAPPQPVEMER